MTTENLLPSWRPGTTRDAVDVRIEKDGKTLIVMDPRGTALKRHARHVLQFRPGTDVALMLAMMHVLVRDDLVDHEHDAREPATQGHERRHLIDDELVRAHRERGLSPDRPVVRGTSQNPDTFFQAREAANTYYLKTPGIVADYRRAAERVAEELGIRAAD